jgi:hypothetical protein
MGRCAGACLALPSVSVRENCQVDGLVADRDDRSIRGVRTGGDTVTADLVVDYDRARLKGHRLAGANRLSAAAQKSASKSRSDMRRATFGGGHGT